MSNPFLQDMVKMEIPKGMGNTIAHAGFTIEADEDGCVEVPKKDVPVMESLGLHVHVHVEKKK